MGKMRLVQIVLKISHGDNETIKPQPLEYLFKCVVCFAGFFFCQDIFMLIHVSEQHLEAPTSLCSLFWQAGLNVSVLTGSKFCELTTLVLKFFPFS